MNEQHESVLDTLTRYAAQVEQAGRNIDAAIDTINNWIKDLDRDGHSPETKEALRDMADDVLYFLERQPK